MSHEALGKLAKSHNNNPNVWFVGLTPRRNPELVVAVLWQNGDKSYYPARMGSRIVAAYVEKQRRLANNLAPTKSAATGPVEVGAVWSVPDGGGGAPARVKAGRFLIDPAKADGGGTVAAAPERTARPVSPVSRTAKARDGVVASNYGPKPAPFNQPTAPFNPTPGDPEGAPPQPAWLAESLPVRPTARLP
jgi:membrane peptidoglycan carboxypeptidase